jgi:hypothetical protein
MRTLIAGRTGKNVETKCEGELSYLVVEIDTCLSLTSSRFVSGHVFVRHRRQLNIHAIDPRGVAQAALSHRKRQLARR